MAYGVLVPQFVIRPEDGRLMLRTNCLSERGLIDLSLAPSILEAQNREYRRTILAAGDLILSVVGSMGRSAVVGEAEAGANLNRPLARLQPIRDLPSRLLWHWTQTRQFHDQARIVTQGDTAQPTLNLGDLAQFHVGLPRDASTWNRILHELDRICDGLNAAEDALVDQIKLIREHRQALITAAVAGELAIPGYAA